MMGVNRSVRLGEERETMLVGAESAA